MPKRRLVIAGLGDSGVQAAMTIAELNPELEIVGITPKPCHHSGQELGGRLAFPACWAQMFLVDFASVCLLTVLERGKVCQSCCPSKL